ncbi:hypothetical protein [Mycolicibacterium iranicum]|uniref:hypothetical protein n=1 Tax=Mycolicibacterium iranicum TaxID=912594 RepID=UPI0013A57DA9|nr:hypothetical protein [Mycolicibacterium iranicum]
MAKQFGNGVLAGLDVDRRSLGFKDKDIDDLVEYMLRMLRQSRCPTTMGARRSDHRRVWSGWSVLMTCDL